MCQKHPKVSKAELAALKEHGWVYGGTRGGGHLLFTRLHPTSGQRQTLTRSASPSDCRASKSFLADLIRQNDAARTDRVSAPKPPQAHGRKKSRGRA